MFLSLLLILSLLPMGGCAKGKSEREQTLVVDLTSLGNETWLPNLASYADNYVMESCYEFLCYTKPGTLELEPGLAESWEMSPDGMTWTFHLRQGVQWHNGWGEFTADDVQFSLELAKKEGSVNTLVAFVRNDVQSVEVADDYTVVFHMAKPNWEVPWNVNNVAPHFPMVCKAYVQDKGEDYASRNPIGTGPYRFVDHSPGSYIKFEAVEDHWRQTPYYKYLKIMAVPEEATRIAMLLTGEADIIDMLPTSREAVEEVAGLRVSVAPNVVEYDLYFGGLYLPETPTYDPTIPWVDPVNGLKVRQAMALAINRQEIVDYVLFGTGKCTFPLPAFYEGMPWTKLEWTPYPYDPDTARSLLAEAGYPHGFPVTIDTWEIAGRVMGPSIAEAIASYWEDIGLDVTINRTDWGTFYAKWKAKQTLGCYIMPWKRPVEPGKQYYYTHTTVAPSPILQISKEFDALVKANYDTIDADQRHQVLEEFGQILYDNYFQIAIATADALYGINDRVGAWELPAYPAAVYYEYITPLAG
jgi:peptide/nickel transport system substrate-binding protein